MSEALQGCEVVVVEVSIDSIMLLLVFGVGLIQAGFLFMLWINRQ